MLNTTLIILAIFIIAFVGFVVYDLATAKRRKEVYRAKSTLTAYLMLLPAVVLAFLFIMLPILYSLGYAFTDYYLLKPNDINFIWFDNFKAFFSELATKGTLYHAIKNTIVFVVGVVPLQRGNSLKDLVIASDYNVFPMKDVEIPALSEEEINELLARETNEKVAEGLGFFAQGRTSYRYSSVENEA